MTASGERGQSTSGERVDLPTWRERLADWLCWNGWGMRLNDPELAEGVRDDWREDARKMASDLGIQEVGIDYCLVHSGTRNEDDSADNCDWFGRLDEDDERDCDFVPLVYFGSNVDGHNGGRDAGGPAA